MTDAIVRTDASSGPGSAATIGATRHNSRLFDVMLLGVLAASSLIYFWLATRGTWNPQYDHVPRVLSTGHFFLAQARGILHARLWVHPSQTAYDCFIHNGKCYGYFGLTPSVLRLPFLALLDHYNSGFTPVFITAALTLATGSFLASLRHLLSHIHMAKATAIMVALTALGLGAAGVLTQLTQPDVYDEAIAWAVGFLSLAVFCFIRWWENQRSRWYVLLLISLILATNARPTALPFALIVGLAVGYRIWRSTGSSEGAQSALLGGAMIILPIATCIGVFLMKFGQPIPSYLLDQQIAGPHATPRWIKIRRIDHNQLTSLKFTATALFAYLRPDALDFSRTFPWVYFRFRTTFSYTGFGAAPITYIGLPRGSLYSGTVTSLTVTMPLSFVVAVGAVADRLRRHGRAGLRHLRHSHPLRPGALWKVVLLVAAVGSWGVVLTGVAVEDRFLADAYPLMGLLLLLGLPGLVSKIDNGGRLLKFGALMVILMGTSWQLLVNIGLAWRYPGA